MISRIAVLGSGTMGHGIAEAFAIYGYEVSLYSPRQESLENAVEFIEQELNFLKLEEMLDEDISTILGRIKVTSDLKEAVKNCGYLIESIPEDLGLKQSLFTEIDQLCGPEVIFSTNTSSFGFDEVTASLSESRKKNAMICHWFNPAHLIPLVELSFFGNMSSETYDIVEKLYLSIGKQPVKIQKSVPGLIANRIMQGVAREVYSLLEQGVASPEDIDKALKFGPAFRYATMGHLAVADFGGLDIWQIVGNNLLPYMDCSLKANPLLAEMVAEGRLGIKSGEGFYLYKSEEVDEVRQRVFKNLICQLKTSKEYVT